MEVAIITTKTCRHCPQIEQNLKELGIPYDIIYAEDNSQLCEEHCIGSSPNKMVDGKIVFQGMPILIQLKEILQIGKPESDWQISSL
jgi:predicted thioredoxin/glutaredoxin